MKKILFMLILLIPFLVYAEYDESKVTIESFYKSSTEGLGKEEGKAFVNGTNVTFHIQFTELYDSVTYDMVIKNESGEDIELYNRSYSSDYVDYILTSSDSDYVVKNGASKSFQLEVEYANQVPDSEADDNVYYDNKTYSLEVSNELGRETTDVGIVEGGDTHDAVDPVSVTDDKDKQQDDKTKQEDVPKTVDNPNTKAVKNILAIVCIVFVISIGLWLILRRKNKLGKIFVFIGLIGIITPIVVYAYKDFKMNFDSHVTILVGIAEAEPAGDEVVEVETSGNPICVPANVLHTETCRAQSNLASGRKYYCSGQGIPLGQSITYGTIQQSTFLNPGDAFDCDVNGDNTYNPFNERFYYLGREDEMLYFIAYSNFNGNVPVKLLSESKIPYHASNAQTSGPVTAVQMLPTKQQWPTVSTGLGSRVILDMNGGSVTTFNYGRYAARFPTYREIRKACPLADDIAIDGLSKYNRCSFLLENTIYTDINNTYGYWLETPNFNDHENIWMISGRDKRIYWDRAANQTNRGVRPVIEVNYRSVQLNTH